MYHSPATRCFSSCSCDQQLIVFCPPVESSLALTFHITPILSYWVFYCMSEVWKSRAQTYGSWPYTVLPRPLPAETNLSAFVCVFQPIWTKIEKSGWCFSQPVFTLENHLLPSSVRVRPCLVSTHTHTQPDDVLRSCHLLKYKTLTNVKDGWPRYLYVSSERFSFIL